MTRFVGMNFRGMILTLQDQYKFPLSTKEEDSVTRELHAKVRPCANIDAVLADLAQSYTLAVVSASLQPGSIATYTPTTSSVPPRPLMLPTSKPDPAIYIHACKSLGTSVAHCVAVEDSQSGGQSAVCAGINVLGYVGAYGKEKQAEMRILLKAAGALNVGTTGRTSRDHLRSYCHD
ncbi:hypothetical protein DFJ77DRAFT_440007 [Powellomyces hirtus]|nr:hypothetical protein DFJ77DRAFT_440007 [Powellomyces hirtus]